jgi:predicted RNase H-like nuclease
VHGLAIAGVRYSTGTTPRIGDCLAGTRRFVQQRRQAVFVSPCPEGLYRSTFNAASRLQHRVSKCSICPRRNTITRSTVR